MRFFAGSGLSERVFGSAVIFLHNLNTRLRGSGFVFGGAVVFDFSYRLPPLVAGK